jgi:IS5 family transposase
VIKADLTNVQIRSSVKHPFHIVMNLFRHHNVRYKGFVRNTARLFSLLALANLAGREEPTTLGPCGKSVTRMKKRRKRNSQLR